MKKLLNLLLVIQLLWVSTGCCCPCAKKASEQPSQPPAQEKPASQMEAK